MCDVVDSIRLYIVQDLSKNLCQAIMVAAHGLWSALILGGVVAVYPCTSTLSPSESLPSAVGMATDGDVICLKDGTYDTGGSRIVVDGAMQGSVTIRAVNPGAQ